MTSNSRGIHPVAKSCYLHDATRIVAIGVAVAALAVDHGFRPMIAAVRPQKRFAICVITVKRCADQSQPRCMPISSPCGAFWLRRQVVVDCDAQQPVVREVAFDNKNRVLQIDLILLCILH